MTANPNLANLNNLSAEAAEAALLACCGSARWARRMVQRRPFENADDLIAAAEAIWQELAPEDWREAFSKHPRIGDRPKQASDRERAWSEQEQAAVKPDERIQSALEDGNRAYLERFGYIFIVCATGKTAEEMLAILTARLQNGPDAELKIAADEQSKITELRLRKFLGL